MSKSSSASSWVLVYMKLQFFARIRRFIQTKAKRKESCRPSDRLQIRENHTQESSQVVQVMNKEGKGEKQNAVLLQKSVKKLHFGNWEEKEAAAKVIQRLATEDVKVRKQMTELGVVSVLVSMVASEVSSRQQAAVKALIKLVDGTYKNKALMLEAGILSKLPDKFDSLDEQTRREFAELLSSLSSLANTQFPFVASSEFLPSLVAILESSSSFGTIQSCVGALYNLSNILENAGCLVSNGIVETLLKLSPAKEVSEKALETLSNLVVTSMGKKAMEDSAMVPDSLIDILSWEDKPKCQELSAYILMILAHESSVQRRKMAQSGIVPVLLEVALLGSPLGQKRALKLLQWFKDERQGKMRPHSGPQRARIAVGSPVHEKEAQEGRKMMKSLVRQSLHRNMETLAKRAHASGDESSLKALVISTSSKSLPY